LWIGASHPRASGAEAAHGAPPELRRKHAALLLRSNHRTPCTIPPAHLMPRSRAAMLFPFGLAGSFRQRKAHGVGAHGLKDLSDYQ
jgi:hypothetical protein